MKVYDATTIRNVALVGHSGSGKTQLTSAILSDGGMVNRFGKVDEGTTVTDFDEEEIARKHTLSASLAYVEWNKHKINLIDTPGIGNFLSDAKAALHVADAALVVVDAVSGVMVQTEKVWEAAEELGRIVDLQVRALSTRLRDRRIALEVTDDAKAWLAATGYDPAFGARPLRRLVQREIGDRLATALLAGQVRDGDSVKVALADSGDGLTLT